MLCNILSYVVMRKKSLKITWLVVIDGDEDNEGHVDYALNLNGVRFGSKRFDHY